MTVYLVFDADWAHVPELTSWMDVEIKAFASVADAVKCVVNMSEERAARHNEECARHNVAYNKAIKLGLTHDELRDIGVYRWEERHGLFFADDWDIVKVNNNGRGVTMIVPGDDIPAQAEWPWTTPFLWRKE